MIDLYQIVRQQYDEKKQQRERQRYEHSPRQPLISSSQVEAQSQSMGPSSSNVTVDVLQRNQSINTWSRNAQLSNVTQSNEFGNSAEQNRASNHENKINLTAAMLSLLMYLCCISAIAYGSYHLYDCPAEKMIPISFIVMGCLVFVSRLLSSPEEYRNIFKNENNSPIHPKSYRRICLNVLIQLSILGVFSALCYWIFHINPDTKEGSPNYCDKDVYKTIKISCILGLSVLGLSIVLLCCGVCIVACKFIRLDD